jgi:hypothetical protein
MKKIFGKIFTKKALFVVIPVIALVIVFLCLWFLTDVFKKKPSTTSLVETYERTASISAFNDKTNTSFDYFKEETFDGIAKGYSFSFPDSLWTKIKDKFPNKGNDDTNPDEKKTFEALLLTSNYSAIGFNRFYLYLDRPMLTKAISKKEALALKGYVSDFETNLTNAHNAIKKVLQTSTFNPESAPSDKNLYSNATTALMALIDTNLNLTKTTLNLFNNALLSNKLQMTTTSTYVVSGVLEANAILAFSNALDSYNKLFIRELINTPFYYANGSVNGSDEFNNTNSKTANKVFELGEAILDIPKTKFNDASLEENFTEALRDLFLKNNILYNSFNAVKPLLDDAASMFDFKNLKENVITMFNSDGGWSQTNLQKYIGTIELSDEEKGKGLRPVSAELKNRYLFVENALTNHFEYVLYKPLKDYLKEINKVK